MRTTWTKFKFDDPLNGRLNQDGLAAVKVQDAANSHRLYRLDLLFGALNDDPMQCGIDVACGASRTDVALALRSLADFLVKPNAIYTATQP